NRALPSFTKRNVPTMLSPEELLQCSSPSPPAHSACQSPEIKPRSLNVTLERLEEPACPPEIHVFPANASRMTSAIRATHTLMRSLLYIRSCDAACVYVKALSGRQQH